MKNVIKWMLVATILFSGCKTKTKTYYLANPKGVYREPAKITHSNIVTSYQADGFRVWIKQDNGYKAVLVGRNDIWVYDANEIPRIEFRHRPMLAGKVYIFIPPIKEGKK